MQINCSWSELKNFIATRKLPLQWVDLNGKYYVSAFDGVYSLFCELYEGDPDRTDFENNFKEDGNKRLQTRIEEEEVYTGGNYQSQSFEMSIGAGEAEKVMDISFPIPISVLSGEVTGDALYQQDDLEVFVYPDTITGTITSDVAVNDTVINVSQSVIDNVKIGFYIKLDDGTNNDDLGRCISIDKNNLKITVETASTNAYLASTPTYIKQTVKFVPHLRLPMNSRVVIGESKIGGSHLPANAILRVRYINNSATTKTFSFILEYLY